MALMVWLYYSWFAILIGAEINAELIKLRTHRSLPLKQPRKPAKPREPEPAAGEEHAA